MPNDSGHCSVDWFDRYSSLLRIKAARGCLLICILFPHCLAISLSGFLFLFLVFRFAVLTLKAYRAPGEPPLSCSCFTCFQTSLFSVIHHPSRII
ncbi:hypothetical protein I7I50_02144 [Histoplasma capsulatum G186AR]|uniref:Uncharacterized protein n=1 Tax=Ajellomyces capsulatus TaxID=5037 RepID=A0A8H8CT40_AJECA|nr:hypothetical protein I7I52_12358 [Histoplasma capsulatum]QSS71345.1 hypothetical protein I7I50_02144 [Histoplasma capsulatum G186AR]